MLLGVVAVAVVAKVVLAGEGHLSKRQYSGKDANDENSRNPAHLLSLHILKKKNLN